MRKSHEKRAQSREDRKRQIERKCQEAGKILMSAVGILEQSSHKAQSILRDVNDELATYETEARRVRHLQRNSRLRSVARDLLQIRPPTYQVQDDRNVRTASDVDVEFSGCLDSLNESLVGMQRLLSKSESLDQQLRSDLEESLSSLRKVSHTLGKVSVTPLYESVNEVRESVMKSFDLISNTLGILGSQDASVLRYRGAKKAVARALIALRSARRR